MLTNSKKNSSSIFAFCRNGGTILFFFEFNEIQRVKKNCKLQFLNAKPNINCKIESKKQSSKLV